MRSVISPWLFTPRAIHASFQSPRVAASHLLSLPWKLQIEVPRRACASPCAIPADKSASVILVRQGTFTLRWNLSGVVPRDKAPNRPSMCIGRPTTSTSNPRWFCMHRGTPERTVSIQPRFGVFYSYPSSSSAVNIDLASNIGSVDAFTARGEENFDILFICFRDGSILADGSRFTDTLLCFHSL